MSTRTALWVLTLFSATFPLPAAVSPSVVLTHATVIDGTGREPSTDMTIVIEGTRIVGVGKSGQIKPPEHATVVDASGRFLIPGLWDMHVHLSNWTDLALPLRVTQGIMGVRDMGGDLQQIDGWRQRVALGELVGPAIVRAGPIVDGPKPGAIFRWTVIDASGAREAVLALEQQGVDFIKVHNGVPREAYFAVANETKKQGLRFAGHVPMFVTPTEAAVAGQASIEHSESLFESPAYQLAADRAKRAGTYREDSVEQVFIESQKVLPEVFAEFTDEKAKELFRLWATQGTAYTPILAAYREATIRRSSATPPADVRTKYLAASARRVFDQWFPWRRISPEGLATRDAALKRFVTLAGIAHRQGVLVMAGSDAYPGFTLHDELAFLVEAGFTPMEALQAATRNPAIFLGRIAESGSIESGKRADLVLLEANPLEDIRNTTRIAAVVSSGKLFGRKDLDRILAEIEASAPTR
jgi:imidazolonepropionase-like amidohydrolase